MIFDDLEPQTAPVKGQRVAKDYYPTGQPEAILALLHADGERIRASGNVWEPACGKGDMVRHIRSFGIPCCASDIEDRGCPDSWVADYYSCLKSRGGAIITNPPYNEINARDGHGRWLRHTLEMPGWDYLALLLSWDWPAARANGLGELLDEHSFTYCYLMRFRLDFTGEGSPPQRNAWFVWRRSDPRSWSNDDLPNPEFRVLDRVDPRQRSLL
ncbi:hypothetical protein [Roseovarius sp. MMSF_3281]|uniref:hypothetical protein n=1 Tax=Roseovarius sp. MMSF_3281 TaxID=3046694 RepID=UPI00273FD954|nr:hypothetical protein [Roseovarius sp. MMSF_3281]